MEGRCKAQGSGPQSSPQLGSTPGSADPPKKSGRKVPYRVVPLLTASSQFQLLATENSEKDADGALVLVLENVPCDTVWPRFCVKEYSTTEKERTTGPCQPAGHKPTEQMRTMTSNNSM